MPHFSCDILDFAQIQYFTLGSSCLVSGSSNGTSGEDKTISPWGGGKGKRAPPRGSGPGESAHWQSSGPQPESYTNQSFHRHETSVDQVTVL